MKQSHAALRRRPLAIVEGQAVAKTAAVCVLALVSFAGVAKTSGKAALRPIGGTSTSVRTAYLDRSGKFLCAIYRKPHGWWAVEHSYGELWISYSGGRLEADFTHHLDGWARPVTPSRWKVVAAATDYGPYRFYGRIIRQSANRWNFSNVSGHLLGYTLGPDGPAAGTAALVFWWNDNSRQC
jgi:hypothetical protein